MDYAFVSTSDIAAYVYYSIIQLYALTPKLVSAEIVKDGDTYTISGDGSVAKLRFDNSLPSSSLEIFEDGKTTALFESITTGSGEYAYQIYSENGDNTFVVFQFRFKGENGKLSVDYETSNRPTSIYKNASAINDDFANKGDRIYKLENNVFSFTGNLDNPDPGKTVVNLEVIGLKTQYLKNESIDLFSKQVKITYSDNSTENKTITSAMLVGNAPATDTEGSHSFTLSVGGMDKVFTYSVAASLKPVTNLEIVSGLKATYTQGEALDLSNVVIKVTYSDNTTQNVDYASTMLVGVEPDTATLGTNTFILKVNDYQKEFSYQVTGLTLTNEQKLYQSFENFYNDLAFDFDSFNISNMSRMSGVSTEARNFYANDVNDSLVGAWAPLQLLYESAFGIKAYGEGKLTEIYPDPAENNGHNAGCTYDQATQTYMIQYWTTKPLNTYYWYESEVSFDEATDSLKADIFCGYNEGRTYRCHIEYRKLEAGGYACMIYFPEDENNDAGKYTSLLIRFNGLEGDIALNRWVDGMSDQVYKLATSPLNYAKTGDVTLSINSNDFTLTDMESSVENFYNSFMLGTSGNYEGSLEYEYLAKLSSMDADGNLYSDQFSLEGSVLKDAVEIMAQYQKQVYQFDTNGSTVTVVEGIHNITFTLQEEYAEDITYKLYYDADRLSVEYTEGSDFRRVELVKVGNAYYVQRLEKDLYNSLDSFLLSQAQYTDMNNMVLTYDENYANGSSSIFQSIPNDFVTNGDRMFKLTAGTYTFRQSYLISFYADDIDLPSTFTDLDGYLTLPDPQYTDFEGWYIYDENTWEYTKIGVVGDRYRFTQEMIVYAKHQGTVV
jgi:hypothetical protein